MWLVFFVKIYYGKNNLFDKNGLALDILILKIKFSIQLIKQVQNIYPRGTQKWQRLQFSNKHQAKY